MTPALRKSLLGKVHIGKKALGLDDATWRDLVTRVTGQPSCSAATEPQLAALATELVRLGFKAAPINHETMKSRHHDFRKSGKPQVRLVFALWAELGRRGALTNPGKDALRAFCGNQVKHAAPIDPEFLSGEQLRTVIEALKSWVARTEKAGAQ